MEKPVILKPTPEQVRRYSVHNIARVDFPAGFEEGVVDIRDLNLPKILFDRLIIVIPEYYWGTGHFINIASILFPHRHLPKNCTLSSDGRLERHSYYELSSANISGTNGIRISRGYKHNTQRAAYSKPVFLEEFME